ncbi:MAG: transposase, partial [Chloroflexi bacterium]|nr:transposase [Chloroflexota bacterium]
MHVSSRGRYCPQHAQITYLSAEAAHLSLPHSSYGLDVLAQIGYQRDYGKQTFGQIRAELPEHIRVSERHLSNLYREYLALLACAGRLDVDKLKAAAAKNGGLILSVDGLEPEGGQPQLWIARELLTGTLLAAAWLPRVDECTLKAFLAAVEALDLPWLAVVSDKQGALLKALQATWPDLPHQYCQAHYLSNAVTPIYEADEHMKTQLRKQIRAAAGPTLRQVQSEAKQGGAEGTSTLIVTGMAVTPPPELHQVKAVVQAVQQDGSGKLPPAPVQATPAQPLVAPQTIAEVRTVLHGSNVLVHEHGSHQRSSDTATAAKTTLTPPNRQQQTDELVAAYAARLRRVLARSGRKPFRLAGLRLYADLLLLLSSL